MKINENHWILYLGSWILDFESMEINGNICKSMKINENPWILDPGCWTNANQWKSMNINENQ